jgi:hypothetical protein
MLSPLPMLSHLYLPCNNNSLICTRCSELNFFFLEQTKLISSFLRSLSTEVAEAYNVIPNLVSN